MSQCLLRTHLWSEWAGLRIRYTEDGIFAGYVDTQYRKCFRCGRDQRKRWWRR